MLTTLPGTNNGAPNWSHDGKWIYFYSGHDPGAYQLWKTPFAGGPPVRVTTNGGVYAIESEDGEFLYYAKITECRVWKRSLETGQESRLPINICDFPINVSEWFGWVVVRDGIYFLNLRFLPNGRIEFFDFAQGQSIPIFALDKPASEFGGLALSPDGKSLLFGQKEFDESYIMVIKSFR
jgi:hypothetical protein